MALTGPAAPRGNSYELDVTTVSAGVTISLSAAGNLSAQQYIFSNDGGVTAFVTFAASTDAAPTAVAPISGTSANGFPILAGSIQTFNLVPGAKIAAITKTGSTTLYITPCEGM